MLTRRQFLGGVAGATVALPLARWLPAAAAAGTASGPLDPALLPHFVQSLPIPPLWSGADLAANGLRMASGTHRFHPDMGTTPTFGYGGASYLGPVIQVRRGEPVTFRAVNDLGPHPLGVDETLHGPDMADDQSFPRASVHLHGGYTAPGSDGFPSDTFLPGEVHDYTYLNEQQSGSTWFHDHALGITRLNVYAGLAGLYWIRDDVEDALTLPGPYGVYELPIVIQDRSFLAADDGTNPLAYPDPWAPESFGDIAVVNGAIWPYVEVDQGWYRMRIVNGSTSRFYNVQIAPHVPTVLIGTDSGLVDTPRRIKHGITLAPGERADVLVNFTNRGAGDVLRLMNRELPPYVVSPAETEIPEILEFRVTTRKGFAWTSPAALRPYTPLPAGVPVRNVLLTEIAGEEGPVMALLNARPWDTTEIERPLVDTVERWNIVNLTEDTHPIHLHLIQFQPAWRYMLDAERYMLDVFGVPELTVGDVGRGTMPFPDPAPYATGRRLKPARFERGWKDTIQAHPRMVTSILVPFGPGAAPGVPFGSPAMDPFTGTYVWHCHILDHEDNEMMLPYEVVA